jgi:hypothetical protein
VTEPEKRMEMLGRYDSSHSVSYVGYVGYQLLCMLDCFADLGPIIAVLGRTMIMVSLIMGAEIGSTHLE